MSALIITRSVEKAEEARQRLEASGVLDRFYGKDGPNILQEAAS